MKSLLKIQNNHRLFFLLIKWNNSRFYDQIQDKLKQFKEKKNNKIKGELIQFFIEVDKEKNIVDIGKMNNEQLLKKNKTEESILYFEEESHFEPILSSKAHFLAELMEKKILAYGRFKNGVLLIYNSKFIKDSQKKIVAFYFNKNNKIQKGIFTLCKDEDENEKINLISEIGFKKLEEKIEKSGKNDSKVEGMDFKIIKEEKEIEKI